VTYKKKKKNYKIMLYFEGRFFSCCVLFLGVVRALVGRVGGDVGDPYCLVVGDDTD
jgi:hypothetical protein